MNKYASYYSASLSPLSVARVLICKCCHKYIACMDDLLSRAYCGAQSKKAGLFDDVSNVRLGAEQVWLMRTGAHTVKELFCIGCDSYVGFQIVRANERSERWKQGAFVLERQLLYIHSVYECSASEEGSDESGGEERSYQWPGTPLRLKLVDDIRASRRAKRMTVLQAQTQLKSVGHVHSVSESAVVVRPKPLPQQPVPVEAY